MGLRTLRGSLEELELLGFRFRLAVFASGFEGGKLSHVALT